MRSENPLNALHAMSEKDQNFNAIIQRSRGAWLIFLSLLKEYHESISLLNLLYRNLSPILHQFLTKFLIHLCVSFQKRIFDIIAVTYEPHFASPITVNSGHER